VLAQDNVNVKVFLAVYMIAHRPTHVFESMGKLEHELPDAATPLLAALGQIFDCLHTQKEFGKVSHEMTKDFPTLLFNCVRTFKA
jgi:hypothetical protein